MSQAVGHFEELALEVEEEGCIHQFALGCSLP